MDPSEYYTYEDRAYIEPTLSRDEQLGFVNTLRDTIDKNTAQINTQTQKLGTDITPNYGGLTGSNSYFKQRYQTTPVQAQMATLKATAQSKALNDLMTNYQNQAANRYQQAYRNAAAKAALSGGGNGNNGANPEDGDDPDKNTPGEWDSSGDGTSADPLVFPDGSITHLNADNRAFVRDKDTGKVYATTDPTWKQATNGWYYPKSVWKDNSTVVRAIVKDVNGKSVNGYYYKTIGQNGEPIYFLAKRDR